MDEFLDIERHLGEVKAVIGLQFAYETENIEGTATEWEEFAPEEAPVTAAEPVEGEEPPAEGEEAAKKEPAWKPSDYMWTKTNRLPKNLPQIFMGMKGKNNAVHEVKTAEQFSSSQYEAISRSLDEFCQKVSIDNIGVYQQIIFSE